MEEQVIMESFADFRAGVAVELVLSGKTAAKM